MGLMCKFKLGSFVLGGRLNFFVRELGVLVGIGGKFLVFVIRFFSFFRLY